MKIIKKLKEKLRSIKENFAQKTIRQKIRICIVLVLLLTFLFFVIKGNFFDTQANISDAPTSTSQTSDDESSYNEEPSAPRAKNKVRININWIDVGILGVLCIAYGVHKFREKKRERR